MKKLSIIIPQYKETEEQVKALFETLNNQIDVNFDDFEVVIVNDCSDTQISKEFLKQFTNLHIKSMRTPENGGSGMARQWGYDHTKSEYVMFVDADDNIFSLLTLHYVFLGLDCDVLQGQFLQETYFKELDQTMFIKRADVTWMHGKVYKRKFLDKYNIRFPEGVRYSEDTYFNSVIYNLDANIKAMDEPFIIWRNNPNSITRRDGGIENIKQYPSYIYTKELILEKLKPYIDDKKYNTLTVQIVCQFYFDMQKRQWQKAQGIEATESKILLFYAKHQKEIAAITDREFDEIYQDIRDKFFNIRGFRERETITDFYTRLHKKYVS